jgi:hypothetical protein
MAEALEAQPKPWRVLLAFALAPLAAAFLFSLIEGGKLWDVAVLGAYAPAIVLGVPAYFLLRRRLRPRLVTLVLASGIIAAAPWALLSFFSQADQATVGNCVAVVDGKTTWCGFLHTLLWLGQIFAYGAFGGLVFWICAAWKPRRT